MRAILSQVVHHREMYPPDMCLRQIALQLVREPYKYYKYVEQELLETGESYDSYCYNIFHNQAWGDDLIAAVLGDMWNLAISIVTPVSLNPLHLFHMKKEPDVVIVANGGSWMSGEKRSTHFSATLPTDVNHRLPGSGLQNLTPMILQDAVKAKRIATTKFLKDQEEHSLDAMRGVCAAINRMEDKAVEIIQEAEGLRDQVDRAEYLLQELGIRIEKIREAKSELKPKSYVRTEQREKEDAERKRKREEEEEQKHEEEKRIRTIPVGPDGLEIVRTPEKVTPEKQTMEKETIQKQIPVKKDLVEKDLLADDDGGEASVAIDLDPDVTDLTNPFKSVLPMWSHDAESTVLQEQNLRMIQPTQQLLHAAQEILPSEQSTSVPVKKQSRLEQFLPPKTYRVIKRLQEQRLQEQPETSEVATVVDLPKNVILIDSETGLLDSDISSVQLQTQLQIQQLQTQQLQAQLQAQQLQVQQMSSIGIPSKGVSKLRTSTAGPVPEKLQDKNRHYCDKCPAHYTRKDELTNHKQNNCLKVQHDYICEECNKAYYSDSTLMQHYYKVHLKQYLYFCRKCNEGFYYKSYRSTHKNACPKKDGPDLYEGNLQVPPEIMQKFRRRTQIQVTATPSDAMEITEDTEDHSSLYFTGVPASISTVTGVPTIKPKVETYIPTEEDRAQMKKESEEETITVTGEQATE